MGTSPVEAIGLKNENCENLFFYRQPSDRDQDHEKLDDSRPPEEVRIFFKVM